MGYTHGQILTKELIIEQAKKYNQRGQFQKNHSSSYMKAWKMGWIDEICSHMKEPQYKVTETMLQDIANQYSTRQDFKREQPKVYRAIRKRGWINKICSHMPSGHVKIVTKEECRVVAAKYQSKTEFHKFDRGYYKKASKAGYLDEICQYIKRSQKTKIIKTVPLKKVYIPKTIQPLLTKEFVAERAKLYCTRKEFLINDGRCYRHATKNKYLNDICTHMYSPAYSIPQLLCKDIFDKLLKTKGLYNTRKIISPYEIDVYYPNYKLAIEYNGSIWHDIGNAVIRDKNKKRLCKKHKIHLIIIKENNRKYEIDIKNQIVQYLRKINKITQNKFTLNDVQNIVVNYNCIADYCNVLNPEQLKPLMLKCKNINEFSKKFPRIYKLLMRSKQLFKLDGIRQKRKKYNANVSL